MRHFNQFLFAETPWTSTKQRFKLVSIVTYTLLPVCETIFVETAVYTTM